MGVVARRVRPGIVPSPRSGMRDRRPAASERIPSRAALPREQVLEIQRSRLLAGALAAVQEHGYAAAMVAQITQRAKVSRRTFYELFENREACLAALVEEILDAVEGELAQAKLGSLGWRDRVRGGLWVILSFFEREPTLAQMLLVEAQRGGPQIQELREQAVARLVETIDGGRATGSRAVECTPLTAEGLVGATFGILHARLVRGEQQPLTGLLGELMGMIVLPYLGPAAARAERTRRPPHASAAAVAGAGSAALAALAD